MKIQHGKSDAAAFKSKSSTGPPEAFLERILWQHCIKISSFQAVTKLVTLITPLTKLSPGISPQLLFMHYTL